MKDSFKLKFHFHMKNLSRILSRDDASMVCRGIKGEFDFLREEFQNSVLIPALYTYSAFTIYSLPCQTRINK